MNKEKRNSLTPGIYQVYWKQKNGGGDSLAAIGYLTNGDRWLAPINWTGRGERQKDWKAVKRVELIANVLRTE